LRACVQRGAARTQAAARRCAPLILPLPIFLHFAIFAAFSRRRFRYCRITADYFLSFAALRYFLQVFRLLFVRCHYYRPLTLIIIFFCLVTPAFHFLRLLFDCHFASRHFRHYAVD